MDLARLSPANDLDRSGPSTDFGPIAPERLERLSDRIELPRGRRPSGTTLALLAALAGVAAIALGAGAFAVGMRSDRSNVPMAANEGVISLLSKPSTQRIPLDGATGRIILVTAVGGRSLLALDGLDPAPEGMAYRAWLIGPDRKVTASVAVFGGAETSVSLSQLVPPGSGVGVTLERAGDVPAPTRTLKLVAWRTV